MKETGILFSAPMILALLSGRKDVTRRAINFDWVSSKVGQSRNCFGPDGYDTVTDKHIERVPWTADRIAQMLRCPYGGPGDLLYCKEAHWRFGRWVKDGKTKKGRDRWRFDEVVTEVVFEPQPKVSREQLGWHKRPSIFMPKRAARIWRRIVSAGPERLHEITEEEAKREGVEGWTTKHWEGFERINGHRAGTSVGAGHDGKAPAPDWMECAELVTSERTALDEYESLWDHLNGKKYPWSSNPWLWRVESVEAIRGG